jgi:hypothetical protein
MLFFICIIEHHFIHLHTQWAATLERALELAQPVAAPNGAVANVGAATTDATAAAMNRLGDILVAGGIQTPSAAAVPAPTPARTVCSLLTFLCMHVNSLMS